MTLEQPLLTLRASRKISLTALIDVVFILLMFFMLTASFTQYAELTLNTPTASANTTNDKPQLLRLSADHSVSIVGAVRAGDVTLDAAISELDLIAPIVLLPHADTDLQSILSTFETLKSSGAQQLVLGDAWGADGA
jgi:biopolymer transport protein ExbD